MATAVKSEESVQKNLVIHSISKKLSNRRKDKFDKLHIHTETHPLAHIDIYGNLLIFSISNANSFKTNKIRERLNSFLDLTTDEEWPHKYHSEEINSYFNIVDYLFSDTSIDPLIFPIADGGIAIQFEEGKLSTGIEINVDLEFISYMCYDKSNKIFTESFKVPLTLHYQSIVKNRIRDQKPNFDIIYWP